MDGDDSHLQMVAETHNRIDALIEDLLTVTRHRRAVIHPEILTFGTVVEDAVATLPTDGLTVTLDGGDVQFLAEQSRLCECLENLLANAEK